MWYPRRMLKSESRRRLFAGDCDATPILDVAVVLVVTTEKMECAAALLEEGAGEAVRAGRTTELYAGLSRGTGARRSPVESTEGGLVSESLVSD